MKMLSSLDMQRFAAARALEWGQAKGAVAGVKVDGAAVSLDEARQALAEVKQQAAAPSTMLDRLVDRFDAKVKTFEGKLSGNALGKKAVDVLMTDPERVAKKLTVDVAFKDGHTEQLTLEVVDVRLTALLNRLSATAEVASLTPVIGEGFTVLAALAATAGAKLSSWEGKAELAEALQKAALKQWVLAGVGFLPGLGMASGLMAAARDWKDKEVVTNGPAVSVIAEPA